MNLAYSVNVILFHQKSIRGFLSSQQFLYISSDFILTKLYFFSKKLLSSTHFMMMNKSFYFTPAILFQTERL